MGASDSTLSSASATKTSGDGIITVSERLESVDPIMERLRSLQISGPILKNLLLEESSLTDILVRKPSSSPSGIVNAKVLMELFSVYREWQELKVQEISKNQEIIENKIEVADALTTKLLQRFNYSVSTMKITSQHLSEVHALQVDIGELKGRLTEVISNYDSLCKRISFEGPEFSVPSGQPFGFFTAEASSVQGRLTPPIPDIDIPPSP